MSSSIRGLSKPLLRIVQHSRRNQELKTFSTYLEQRSIALSKSRPRILPSSSPTLLHHSPSSISQPLIFSRSATHGAAGVANGSKSGAGKRLGAKKTGSQYVIPGHIIFRQRGTKWHPGENCGVGRDHTIFARVAGYVRYYRDPARHPEKKYIGVALNKDDRLPKPLNAARKRRLGLLAVPLTSTGDARDSTLEVEGLEGKCASDLQILGDGSSEGATMIQARPVSERAEQPYRSLSNRRDYSHREANWQIGRAAEQADVKVKLYRNGDRFKAWRKRKAKSARAAERRALGKGKARK